MTPNRRRCALAVAGLMFAAALAACVPPPPPPPPPTAWSSPALFGLIQSRPVVVGNTAVVATEGDKVYGLSLTNGSILWGANLGTPEPLADVQQLAGLAPLCGNIRPLGVTSNLVVDNGTVWVVGEREKSPAAPSPHVPQFVLAGINPANGSFVLTPHAIDSGIANPPAQQQRAGLVAANGNVYVGFGGLVGDCGDYHGYVVSARESDGNVLGTFKVANTLNNHGGAVWGTLGPVTDGTSVYASTGNSFNPPPVLTDHSDAVVKLDANAGLTDYFQPSGWRNDDANDLDLGSAGPAIVSGDIFQIGKQQTAFLLDPASLGGLLHETPLTHLDMSGCTSFGGSAVIGSDVYVACSGGVRQVHVATGPASLTAGWNAPVSANGPVAVGAGLVWSVDTSAGILYGLDPSDGHVVASHVFALDSSQHFATPTVAAVLSHHIVMVEAGTKLIAYTTP